MKVKVIRKFRDIHTNDIHEVGDVLEVTEERFEEINSKKQFVRKTRATRKKTKVDEPEQATEAEAPSSIGTTEAQADALEGGE